MIDREHDLPITRQAEVLNISRGSVYYLPRPAPEADLAIMRRLDQLHLRVSFRREPDVARSFGCRGMKVGRRHVKTLMRRMGIEALYRRPRTTVGTRSQVYPYLLRGMEITRPNQVWAMDITYIPMARGFVYLAVVLDWFSRRVLAWRLSITMEASFASRRCRRRWPSTASRRFQHGPRLAVHGYGLHRCADRERHHHQHGRQGRMARQCLRRAAVFHGRQRG